MRLATLALFALLAATAPAARAAKPDLVVSKGSLAVHGQRVVGSVSFRNTGTATAPRSTAALTAKGKLVYAITVLRMAPGTTRVADISARLPKGVPDGTALRVCADARQRVAERREGNNCRRVGTVGSAGSTVPPDPISYQADTPFQRSTYWAYVPASYDRSHRTPTTLFVWMHGCGGDSGGDIYNVAPADGRSYIAVSLGGRDGDCWNVEDDQAKVLAAIRDVESHFNVDRRRVILGGYSSGGDLAYRTAFYHAPLFAGVLAENTSPFRDTGSTKQQSLAAAAFKFHVVHLAHTGDETYPIDGVREEVKALKDAGFPVQLIERPGSHYDPDTDTTGTDHDLRTILLPHIADGWLAP